LKVNCKDCLEKLDRYVDRELTDQELAEVKDHLQKCPPCDQYYQLEAGVKRLVKLCCDQGQAPPQLRERLNQILF
jgi:anti-sigma factor (TIGR02949 family)